MLKKYRIQKILKSYIALGTAGKDDLIKQLAAFGPVSFSLVLESVYHGHILLEDGRRILASLFKQENINDYILLLSNPQSKIRNLVKGILSEKAGKKCVPMLLENFDHPTTVLRNEVVDLLKEHLDVGMVSKIARFIDTEGSEISKNAVELLGMIGGADALGVLLATLKNGNTVLKRAVAKSLIKGRDAGAVLPLSELLLEEKDQRLLMSILEFFSDFLTRGADDTVVSAVKFHLTSQDLLLRQRAVDVLGKIATVSIIPDILALLKGEEVNIRRSVVDILNMIKDPRAGEVLIHCVQDKDWWVREIATEALLKISEGNDSIKEELLALLSSEDESTRRTVAEYFNQVTYPPAYSPLLKLLKDEDWWVREKALTALGRIGNADAIPHILACIGDTDIRGAIPGTLASIGSEGARNALLDLMGQEDRVIRVAVLKALQNFDDPLVSETIKRAVLDKESDVSETAMGVLAERAGKRISRYDIELEFSKKDVSPKPKTLDEPPVDSVEDVGFSGQLSLFSLGEVIQNLEAAAKSGCLFMPSGKIYFDRGQLVHCEVKRGDYPEITGEDAVYELFTLKEGTFKFVADQKSDRLTVTEPTMSVVLEAARRVDEKKR